MLSQGHVGAPLYRCIGHVDLRFWGLGSLVEWKQCHYVMVEADILLRALHTFILGIYKVFEPLVCCRKGVWVLPYTVTLAKLAPYLGNQGNLRNENDAITSWLRLISTSYHFIHPFLTYTKCLSHWYAVSREYGCTLIQLHRPSWPHIWGLRSLVEWKCCHNIMVEADIYIKPLHTSIVDIYKVFELLVCCLKGIWVHPSTVTPAKLAPDLGI